MEKETKKHSVTRENIGTHLLEMQLSLIGKDLSVLIDDDCWRFNNTLTMNQYLAFRKYSYEIIQKVFKCNGRKRILIFGQFYDLFGLRLKESNLKSVRDENE